MHRIGIVASKVAKDNLFLYHFFVLLVVFLFSTLIFLIAGSAIVITLILIAYLTNGGSFPDLQKGWIPAMIICMKVLACVVGLLSLSAIIVNVKFRKHE